MTTEVNKKELKLALSALKAIVTWGMKDCYYGTALLRCMGNQFSYSSRYGATAGVNMPCELGFKEPLYVPLKTIQIAMTARPNELVFDQDLLTLNGVKLDLAFSKASVEEGVPLDINQTFGTVKTITTVPLPDSLGDVGKAQGGNDIRQYLNGVCFDLTNHAIVATNGHRMHLANSTTLPEYDYGVLSRLSQEVGDGPNKVRTATTIILEAWQLKLLKAIGATSFAVGRFPEAHKDLENIKAQWTDYPGKDSSAYLVRSKGAHGFFIGKSHDHTYVDWQRVLPTVDALDGLRATEMAYQALGQAPADKLESLTSFEISEAAKWQARYPREVRVSNSANVVAELRRYVKGRKMEFGNDCFVGVRIDLQRGLIEQDPDTLAPLSIPVEVLDKFEYAGDTDEHIVGVNANYLADAMEFVGDADWCMRKTGSLYVHQGIRSAVVMTMNI